MRPTDGYTDGIRESITEEKELLKQLEININDTKPLRSATEYGVATEVLSNEFAEV